MTGQTRGIVTILSSNAGKVKDIVSMILGLNCDHRNIVYTGFTNLFQSPFPIAPRQRFCLEHRRAKRPCRRRRATGAAESSAPRGSEARTALPYLLQDRRSTPSH